ncbi:MAG: phosphodiester glycosidase family protein [Cyanobacteria bacterium J06638_28]
MCQEAPSRPTAVSSSSLAAVTAQGDQVVVPGHPFLPIPWQQRGDRIGLADIPLMRYLGLDLQDTPVAGQQPVLWFAAEPEALPTWYDNGHRYLDMTDWADEQNWSLRPVGNELQLQFPLPFGRIEAGRRAQQSWGDRLVLEVNEPVPWVLEETANEFTLQVQAYLDFEADALTSAPGNLLANLEVSVTKGSGTLIHGTFDQTARPRVWSLTNPDRIVIDITQGDVVPRDIRWAPGIRWRDEYLTVGNRAFPVHQIHLEPETAASLCPLWPNPEQMPGIAPLATTTRNWGAVAAINGGFFNRNNQLPLGAIRRDGQWISGPILNRGAIAWNNQGQFLARRLFLTHVLTTALEQRFTVKHINSGYVEAGIGLYTPHWGTTYTPILDNEILVTVEQNRVVQQIPAGAAGSGAYPIPPTGALLVLRADSTAARALAPGTAITLTPETRPVIFDGLPHALGGGPLLVQGGQVVLNAQAEGFSNAFVTQAAPRSAIGITQDGTVLLVAVHYSPGGRGPTLQETAQIMRQLGAQDALNLDGGNSASLYLGGSLLNRHPDTVGRVHNGLGVFLPLEMAAPE